MNGLQLSYELWGLDFQYDFSEQKKKTFNMIQSQFYCHAILACVSDWTFNDFEQTTRKKVMDCL